MVSTEVVTRQVTLIKYMFKIYNHINLNLVSANNLAFYINTCIV